MKLSEAITKYGDVDIWKCPEAHHGKAEVIIKDDPELKKIDMSRCIESGIDCEFSHDFINRTKHYGKLREITKRDTSYILDNTSDYFPYCRPRMSPYVHACPDGLNGCPLPEGFEIVQYYVKGMRIVSNNTVADGHLVWSNIVAFEVIGVADGYTLERNND